METMSLTEHFGLKLKLTQTSLLFLKEDSNLKETVSTINSNVLILNDVKEKIVELKESVRQWKDRITQVNCEISPHIAVIKDLTLSKNVLYQSFISGNGVPKLYSWCNNSVSKYNGGAPK